MPLLGRKRGRHLWSGFYWLQFQTVVSIRLAVSSHILKRPHKSSFFLIKWISAWLPMLSHKAWPSLEGQCAAFYVSRHQLISRPSLTTLARMTAGSPSSALTKRQKLGSPSHHAETTLTWGRGEGEGVSTGVHDASALRRATRWIWGSLTGWRGVQNPVKITIMIFFLMKHWLTSAFSLLILKQYQGM